MATTPALRLNSVQPRRSLLSFSKRFHPSAPCQQPSRLTRRRDSLLATPLSPTHTIFNRSFMSLPQRASSKEQPKSIGMEWSDFSAARKIQWLLREGGDDKWGWVIYRCTYKSELYGHWKNLKRLVEQQTRESIAESDAPDIAEKLDWVFVEDPELEHASLDELKRRFRAWARVENPNYNIDNAPGGRGSRYTYFIQVDEAALRSMPNVPDDPTNPGHVNIVRAWRDSLPPEEATEEFGEAADHEDWMRIQARMLDIYFYIELDDDESWYRHYSPPPHNICAW